MRIDTELGFLEKPDGVRVSLTASERRALQLLLDNPYRLLTRNQILDAVSEPGSDKSDRNVDFLINRLRRKLSDNARKPSYIATRYGEGYIWIAQTGSSVTAIAEADVVVGPVLGLESHIDPDMLQQRSRAIYSALSRAFGPEKTVVYAPDCPPPKDFPGSAPDHSVELAFFQEGTGTNCVVTLREFETGRVEAAQRFALDDLFASGDRLVQEMRALVNQGWLRRLDRPIDNTPLPVAVYAAAAGQDVAGKDVDTANNRTLLELWNGRQTSSYKAILENEKRLRVLLDDDPQNAVVKLLLAMTIQSKYVKSGPILFLADQDSRPGDEDEIETLVTEALPFIRATPEYVIVAGKLLHFIQRRYDDLARDLCETAYSESVSVAGSLSIIGQMRSFFGQTDAAIQCLDQALNFSKPGSHAYLYALVIKCQTLAAAGEWERLKSARQELSGSNRLAGFALEPIFSDPKSPTVVARAATYLLPQRRSAAMLMHVYYTGARLFADDRRGRNLMSCLSGLLIRRHGVDVVPHEIVQAYPQLISEISDNLK